MAEKRAQRRLAAILVADVVAYSRLMEADEAGTLEALRSRRKSVLDPVVKAHDGRIVKAMGDGVLIEFASAVKAVEGAIELQRQLAAANDGLPEDRRILVRMGINLGDIVIEGSDIFGDGVNLAARLEALAVPGGICISAKIHDEVRGKIDASFEDVGDQKLKNIGLPVRAYRLSPNAAVKPDRPFLALPDKPSIAVLPFTNMSSNPEQEFFADGLTEDLITDLSRNDGLFVIARNSVFAYKGKSADVREIARALGVRYVLEGSARRAAGRVRINVQLIDALGGAHLWAERFDRDLQDIFAVQDEVTSRIVEALVGRLTRPAASRSRTSNLEAYDLCVRGRILTATAAGSPEAIREARELFRLALELDSEYAEAHRWYAFNLWASWAHATGEPRQPSAQLSVEHARKAVTLDPNDANNHWALGHVLAYERQWEESDKAFAKALELDPNNADALAIKAEFAAYHGDPTGLENVQRAFRLNPQPPGWYYWELGLALYATRDYETAITVLRNEATYRTASRRILAASLAQLGRLDEAKREAKLFLSSNPGFTISHWVESQPIRNESNVLALFAEGYRKAGLPD